MRTIRVAGLTVLLGLPVVVPVSAQPDLYILSSGFHLNGSLPAGTYLLAVFARSTVTGTFNNVRAFRIVVTPPASGQIR